MNKTILKTLIIIAFVPNVLASDLTPVVKEKATSLYDENYEPEFIQEVKLDAAQVTLANGAVFKHAGFGATIGFKGKRLNYTGQNNASLIGPFLLDKNGNFFIEYVEFRYIDSKDPYKSNWQLIDSKIIRVSDLNWEFKNLKENLSKLSQK